MKSCAPLALPQDGRFFICAAIIGNVGANVNVADAGGQEDRQLVETLSVLNASCPISAAAFLLGLGSDRRSSDAERGQMFGDAKTGGIVASLP